MLQQLIQTMPLELMLTALPVMLFAGAVHGTFGIGFPLIATPLLALFTDVLTAVLITLLPTIAINLAIIGRGGVTQLKAVAPYLTLLPFALLGTLTGTYLLLIFDPRPFLLLLAAAIILYLNLDLLKGISLKWVHRRRHLALILFGTLAGIMAGTVNVMMPILVILFLELNLAAASMTVMFNISFLLGKLTQLLFFSIQPDDHHLSMILAAAPLIPAALAGLYMGMQLGKRISSERYRGILRSLLWIMSGVLIARFLFY